MGSAQVHLTFEAPGVQKNFCCFATNNKFVMAIATTNDLLTLVRLIYLDDPAKPKGLDYLIVY